MLQVSVSHSVLSSLCDPMDSSPPGSSVHVILQARILELVAISFSRGFAIPRDQTWVSCVAGNSLPSEPPGMEEVILTGKCSFLSSFFPPPLPATLLRLAHSLSLSFFWSQLGFTCLFNIEP